MLNTSWWGFGNEEFCSSANLCFSVLLMRVSREGAFTTGVLVILYSVLCSDVLVLLYWCFFLRRTHATRCSVETCSTKLPPSTLIPDL